VREATERFAARKESVLVVHENFANARRFVERFKFRAVDVILADLGISSRQVDDGGRGFSFRRDAPLDMRFSRAAPRTAADLVNTLPEGELTRIFREFGEERWAGPIARMILRRRPILTTLSLADTVRAAIPRARWPRDIHPATRVFQALRIAVNAEGESLDALLRDAPDLLAPGGRFAVLSYHSLEDRAVKLAFRRRAADGGFRILAKKPVRPSAAEVERNPRSRSAKLRALGRKS
jgi:16S rRNA (cytosine1402-N4)-methyltransferase